MLAGDVERLLNKRDGRFAFIVVEFDGEIAAWAVAGPRWRHGSERIAAHFGLRRPVTSVAAALAGLR